MCKRKNIFLSKSSKGEKNRGCPLSSSKGGVDAANSRKGSNGIPPGFLDPPEFRSSSPRSISAVELFNEL